MKQLPLLLLFLTSTMVKAQVGFIQEGNASYYADSFEGKVTASGERYSHLKATCSHVSIPFGAMVKITNLENNQTVIARVNDRGPFVPDRIMDVSKSVAERLGFIGKGIVRVRIEVIDNQGLSALSEGRTPKNNPVAEKAAPDEKKALPKVETNQQAAGAPENSAELYAMQIERHSSKGFFIQLGSFKEQANLINLSAEAQQQFGKKVNIQVVNIGNERLFKVLIGPYGSRSDAEKAKQNGQTRYPGCFIVELR